VNARKSSRNWFMTGHSNTSAIKMLAYGSYSTFSLVHGQLSGSDCPGSSIITANGWTLSLGKEKYKIYKSPRRLRVQNAFKLHKESSCRSDKRSLCARILCDPCELSIILPKKKKYSRGKSTVGECRRNPMWSKIRYIRDRCNRGSYNDKA
jgi:hypothetical protein